MENKVKVAILEAQQSIIDGYSYRLGNAPQIEIVGAASFGAQLEPLLAENSADVLLLDVHITTAPDDPRPYPIVRAIARLHKTYPALAILLVSMYTDGALINSAMKAGARGYILKEDRSTIQDLATAVQMVANGGVYFSRRAYELSLRSYSDDARDILTRKQRRLLSFCATHPEHSLDKVAQRFGVKPSTARNLLCMAYSRLGVHNRASAVAKAERLGLVRAAE